MKIFNKKVTINDNITFLNNEISISKIYFNPTSISVNDLLFQTIDYLDEIDVNSINKQVDYHDILKDDFEGFKFNGNNVQVLFYDRDLMIITSDIHPQIKSLYTIDMWYFLKGLALIANKKDFSLIEDNLDSIEKEKMIESFNSCKELPDIIDYLQQNSTSFKAIYYPGSGKDFSPLQLFGNFAIIEKIYFTDYSNCEEINRLKNHFDQRGQDIVSIGPNYFNKNQWDEFLPNENDTWFNCRVNFPFPNHSWGRKIKFNTTKKPNNLFDFYYLTTEAIKTAEILIENKIYPNVLVLQDHGTPGIVNWSKFGGGDSPLYQVFKKCLPEYILMEPFGNTIIWPGYEQVTRPYVPGFENANSMHKSKRALFKLKIH